MTNFLIVAQGPVIVASGRAAELIEILPGSNAWKAVPPLIATDGNVHLAAGEVLRMRASPVTILSGESLIITDPQDPPVPPLQYGPDADDSLRAMLGGLSKFG